ncbi:uncharacterized protein N7506_003540 [Penicillium brevicompactum]|uniref:uncharacterized protein n=1 Tax=Penicillium brevicompactum TaxID=5074 RepID=UPI00253F8ED2|nr:uncharacterized protein N7506_003540 [Penicillium brevicompactum]KAJ5343716.1 hypothetical protein N7506_003540 [Penicillium brevicompactum]
MPTPTYSYTTRLQQPPGLTPLTLPTPTNTNPPQNPPVLNDALAIRYSVFITEQSCSAETEIDTDDARSWHWVLYDGTTAVGTIRLVPPPQTHAPEEALQKGVEEPCVKLTRVAIVPMYRGRGLGRMLVETALGWAAGHCREVEAGIENKGGCWRGLVLVHAQVDVEGMYGRLGFVVDEELGRWDEEGIEHLGMYKRIEVGLM